MTKPYQVGARMRLVVVAVGLGTILSLVSAAPVAAGGSGPIKITAVYFDAVIGSDPLTNGYLNKEYVVIRNRGTKGVNLKGWTLRDLWRANCSCSHIYRFKTKFILRPGKSVRIHTGTGTNTRTDRYWGRTDYVWGDDSDTAILKNASGTTKWKCAWTTSHTSPRYC